MEILDSIPYPMYEAGKSCAAPNTVLRSFIEERTVL